MRKLDKEKLAEQVLDFLNNERQAHYTTIAVMLDVSYSYTISLCQQLSRQGDIEYERGWASLNPRRKK